MPEKNTEKKVDELDTRTLNMNERLSRLETDFAQYTMVVNKELRKLEKMNELDAEERKKIVGHISTILERFTRLENHRKRNTARMESLERQIDLLEKKMAKIEERLVRLELLSKPEERTVRIELGDEIDRLWEEIEKIKKNAVFVYDEDER